MTVVRIALVALLLALGYGWVNPSFAQAPPTGVPGHPGFQVPAIPGLTTPAPGTPGSQPYSGTGGATGTGAAAAKGQDAQWMDKKCLNRGDNSLGACQDVCRNLAVTRASGATEYSGICNY